MDHFFHKKVFWLLDPVGLHDTQQPVAGTEHFHEDPVPCPLCPELCQEVRTYFEILTEFS